MREWLWTVLAFVAALIGLQHFRRKDVSRLNKNANQAATDKAANNAEAEQEATEEIAKARAEATEEIDNAISNGTDLGDVYGALDDE